MVEMILLPAVVDMTGLAGLIGIVFFINKTVVYIRMAIHAAFSDVSELPFFCIRFVAVDTRWGQMGACQGEFGLIVVGNRV